MKGRARESDPPVNGGRRPYRVRLPGFVVHEEIGLGDVVKRMSYAAGIKPCGGCHQRAQRLNRRVVFIR